MTALTRRAALAAPALAIIPASGAGAHPDAEVIRLAGLVVELEAAHAASFHPEAETSAEENARRPEQDRLADLRTAAVDALAPLAPRTLAGLIAKARAAYALADKASDGELLSRDQSDFLALALVEDLLSLGTPRMDRADCDG